MPVLIYKVSTAIVTRINQMLKEEHLTFQQFSILIFMNREGGEVCGRDICQYLGISHATSVGVTSRMVFRDLLLTHQSEEDRRMTLFTLTAEGRAVLARCDHLMLDVRDRFVGCMSHKEYDAFFSSLLKVEEAFKEE